MRSCAIILVGVLCLASSVRAGQTIDVPRENASLGAILHVEVSTSTAGQVHLDSTPPGAIVPVDIRFARPGRVTIPIFVIADSLRQLVTNKNAALAITPATQSTGAGPTGCVVGLDAYQPARGWRPSLSAGARTYAVLIAVLSGVALLASALPRSLRMRWLAFSIASGASIVGIIGWQRSSIRDVDGFGGGIYIPEGTGSKRFDQWQWVTTRRNSIAHRIVLRADAVPLWVDAAHARSVQPELHVDADDGVQMLHVTLRRDLMMAVMWRMAVGEVAGTTRQGTAARIDSIARDFYPTFEVVGHRGLGGAGVAVLRPTTRPLK